MNKNSLKIMTIVGTRPEIIRLSRIMTILDQHVKHIIVNTSQNYDYELNKIFYKDLEIRKPDYFLEVNTSSLGIVLGETIIKSEQVILKEKPDAMLILGDTNSFIAAIIAKRYKIPIYHMEAGNRCFDLNVPEEINRRIIDHTADFNLVYTENARRHLLSEGLPHRRIYLTGSPMFEVLDYYKGKIESSDILKKLKIIRQGYFVVSIHREENVDIQPNLRSILKLLNQLAESYDKPVIVSTHPRTRKRLENIDVHNIDRRLRFLKPFGFADYVHLQKNAICTLSDSGTICEESAILNFPAITVRNSMERPEALDAGSIIITGFDTNIAMKAIEVVISQHQKNKSKWSVPSEYLIPDTSKRVLNLILGTTKLSNIWSGIHSV